MPFTLVYHELVITEDLPLLDGKARRRIEGALRSHLRAAPDRYGIPLRKTLRGYWKYRIDQHRAVFRIHQQEVRIIAVRQRADVYDRAEERSR